MTESGPLKNEPTGDVPDASLGAEREGASGGAGVRNDRQTRPPVAEIELWQGRTHVAHYAGRVLLWGLGNLVAMFLIARTANRVDWLDWSKAVLVVLAVVIVSAIAVLGKMVLRILGNRYRITSERLFVHRGILSQTIDQTELIRVDDVRLYKSLVDRMFDLGTIGIASSDFSDNELRIEGVRQPEKVAEAIRERTRALRGRAMYVENI